MLVRRVRHYFEDFVLDEESFELLQGGVRLDVQPKVLDVLRYLITHRDRLVLREELLQHVWPNVIVGDASLARAVREVRRVLDDDGDRQHVIKTVHGRGYRFVAKLRSHDAELPEVAASTSQAPSPRPDAPSSPARPAPVPRRRDVFIGRAEALDTLMAALGEADSRGGIAVVSGEPGIGKTRLLDEFAALAVEMGTVVLIGRCHRGEGTPPFWPWVQVLRSCFEHFDPWSLPELRQELAEAVQIAPELRARWPELAIAATVDTAERRFRVFSAISRVLQAASRAMPLVVLIDDLHVADAGSLLLLQFLARDLRVGRLLIATAYRDQAASSGNELERTIGLLLREAARSCPLTGFSNAEISSFLQSRRGVSPAEPTVATLARLTGGNPLFLAQLLHLPSAFDDRAAPAFRLPTGMGDAVRRHLELLSSSCHAFLNVAAVAGHRFDPDVIADTLRIDGADATSGLLEAIDNGIVRRLTRQIQGYEFVHSLIQEALYDALPRAERARLHAAVGDALRSRQGSLLSRSSEELAYHYLRAPERAEYGIKYAMIAAERAFSKAAFDVAANLYASALEAATLISAEPQRTRELLLRLGSALGRDGRLAEATQAFSRAASLSPPRSARQLDVDATTVRESFELIIERSPSMTRRFYEILFERYPPAQRLFHRNAARVQERMLHDALSAVLDHLEDVPWLHDTLFSLGARHVDYSVTDDMYDWIGESLIATLAEIAGPDWNRKVEAAWGRAFRGIVKVMLEGAQANREAQMAASSRAFSVASPQMA
jgi:DNA-binding winged helix-turn-helix (wHTH) protein/hemoglobin-like flavoprotein